MLGEPTEGSPGLSHRRPTNPTPVGRRRNAHHNPFLGGFLRIWAFQRRWAQPKYLGNLLFLFFFTAAAATPSSGVAFFSLSPPPSPPQLPRLNPQPGSALKNPFASRLGLSLRENDNKLEKPNLQRFRAGKRGCFPQEFLHA